MRTQDKKELNIVGQEAVLESANRQTLYWAKTSSSDESNELVFYENRLCTAEPVESGCVHVVHTREILQPYISDTEFTTPVVFPLWRPCAPANNTGTI